MMIDIKRLSYDNDKFSHELCILTSNKADLVEKFENIESEIIDFESNNFSLNAFDEIELKNKEEYKQKLERLKTDENQRLYNYHLKVFIRKYNSSDEF